MYSIIRKLIVVIQRKGALETFLYASKLGVYRLTSFVTIFFLKLRGYDVDYSVMLKGHNFFFQSTMHAICVGKGSIIGQHTRISGGGKGKVHIGENVLIDDFTFIMAHEKITIGKNVTIASFCFITDFNHQFKNKNVSVLKQGYDTNPVVVKNNVWIGTHTVVLPGVTIGEGSVIGAGSVVTHSIPANSIAVGNPANVIKKIKQ